MHMHEFLIIHSCRCTKLLAKVAMHCNKTCHEPRSLQCSYIFVTCYLFCHLKCTLVAKQQI